MAFEMHANHDACESMDSRLRIVAIENPGDIIVASQFLGDAFVPYRVTQVSFGRTGHSSPGLTRVKHPVSPWVRMDVQVL